MSIAERTIGQATYLHVRRKFKGQLRQKFINVSGLEGENRRYAEKVAENLDVLFRQEIGNNDDAIINQFVTSEGHLKHLAVRPPSKKSDWSVQFILHNPSKSCSRSIVKYGLEEAVFQAFDVLTGYFDVSLESTPITYLTLRSLYFKTLKISYETQLKNY